MTSLSVTSEFREEYEAERAAWLRRRFLWYTGIAGGFLVLNSIVATVLAVLVFSESFPELDLESQLPREALRPGAISGLLSWLAALLFVGAFLHVRRTRPTNRADLLRIIFWVIVLAGVVKAAQTPFNRAVQEIAEPEKSAGWIGPGPEWMLNVAVLHLVASLFIPWTPKEALKPLVPLLIVGVIVVVTGPAPTIVKVLVLSVSPMIGAPGLVIAGLRQSRFRSKFFFRALRSRYGEMKRELVDARRIHEDLFPAPIKDEHVFFDYRYEPMRQIGGDYLFARSVTLPGREAPVLDLIIVDVTGHGISAALAVNRLHGEIAREYGEKPDASPGEVLTGLNAYLNYSLASHSVYATAICLRADPNEDVIHWASAGHPPAFFRTADGRIDRLASTTFLLGVCAAGDFAPNEQRMRFMPGDRLIAYTDGATEAVNRDGRMLRVDGMQRLVASIEPGDEGRADALLRAIDEYRDGPVKDDTLVVEIGRALRTGQARSTTRSPAQTTATAGSPPNS